MPLESRFGYLFSPSPHAHTAAHEPAHGAFALRHTFSERYGIPQSTTLNLMDYTATGTQLKKYQWDVLHDAQVQVFKGLQGEEEGRMDISYKEIFRWRVVGLRDKRDSANLERTLVKISTTDPTMYTFLLSKNIQIANAVLAVDEYGNASYSINNGKVTYLPDATLIKKDAAGYDADMPLFVRLNAMKSKLDTLYAHIKQGTTVTCPVYTKLYYADKYKADTLINRFNRLKASYAGNLSSLFDAIFLAENPLKYKNHPTYERSLNTSQKKLCDELFEAPPIVTLYVQLSDEEAFPFMEILPNQEIRLDFSKWFGSTALAATAKTLTETCAHEMGHIDFLHTDVVQVYKWSENRVPALGAGEIAGGRYPHHDAQHCSMGPGHAFNNPGGKHACLKENMY